MIPTCLIAALIGPVTAEDVRLAGQIRSTYEANRARLSAAGAVDFRVRDGDLGGMPTIDAFDAALKGDRPRRPPAEGSYRFDGPLRRHEVIAPGAGEAARRSGPTSGHRLLTDGDTTLSDRVEPDPAGAGPRHLPDLQGGVSDFFGFRFLFPIDLGNPNPPDYDLGRALGSALDGRPGATLAEVDRSADLDGSRVVRLRVDLADGPARRRITFWVDPDRGALPLRVRMQGEDPDGRGGSLIQVDHADLRRVGDGWLPFRLVVAEVALTPEGATSACVPYELAIERADFNARPPRSAFALSFPAPVRLTDPDRGPGLGPRRTWHVDDFSREARRAAAARADPGPPLLSRRDAYPLALVAAGVVAAGGCAAMVRRAWRPR